MEKWLIISLSFLSFVVVVMAALYYIEFKQTKYDISTKNEQFHLIRIWHKHDEGVFFIASTPEKEKYYLHNLDFDNKSVNKLLEFKSYKVRFMQGSNKNIAVISEWINTNLSVGIRLHYILDGEYKGYLEEFSFKYMYVQRQLFFPVDDNYTFRFSFSVTYLAPRY